MHQGGQAEDAPPDALLPTPAIPLIQQLQCASAWSIASDPFIAGLAAAVERQHPGARLRQNQAHLAQAHHRPEASELAEPDPGVTPRDPARTLSTLRLDPLCGPRTSEALVVGPALRAASLSGLRPRT